MYDACRGFAPAWGRGGRRWFGEPFLRATCVLYTPCISSVFPSVLSGFICMFLSVVDWGWYIHMVSCNRWCVWCYVITGTSAICFLCTYSFLFCYNHNQKSVTSLKNSLCCVPPFIRWSSYIPVSVYNILFYLLFQCFTVKHFELPMVYFMYKMLLTYGSWEGKNYFSRMGLKLLAAPLPGFGPALPDFQPTVEWDAIFFFLNFTTVSQQLGRIKHS